MELEPAVAVGRRALGDVDGDGLRVAAPGPPRLEALLRGWRGRHGVLVGNALAAGFQEDVQDGRGLLLCEMPVGSLSLLCFSAVETSVGNPAIEDCVGRCSIKVMYVVRVCVDQGGFLRLVRVSQAWLCCTLDHA